MIQVGNLFTSFFMYVDPSFCLVVLFPILTVDVPMETIVLSEGDERIQLGPDRVVSTIEFTCTVVNEGVFQFEWTTPNEDVQYQMTLADAGRTSIVEIFRLSAADAGEYECEASYHPDTLVTAPFTASRTTTLELEGKVEWLCLNV